MSQRSPELSDALSALIVQQPFYAVLLFDLLEIREGDEVERAATDGKTIFVNPAFFKQITVPERIGVLCHEVLHCVLEHPTRNRAYQDRGVGPDLKPWNHKKMNYAMDYIINQMVHEAGMKLPLGSLFNPQITSDDIADEVYCKIPDPPEDDKNWDDHESVPAADDNSVPDKSVIQRAVKMAETAAKSQGNMPAGLKRLIDEVCEPKVIWTDYVLRNLVTMSGHDEQSYAKPNRRRLVNPPHIYWPGRVGARSGVGGILIDTSGSTTDQMQCQFFGEMHGILQDCLPEKLYVGFVDAELHGGFHEVEDVNDLLELKGKVAGGGGTNLPVFFDEAKKAGLELDWVVAFTDGYTPWGEDPGYPVIWCITTEEKAPWGLSVHVPL